MVCRKASQITSNPVLYALCYDSRRWHYVPLLSSRTEIGGNCEHRLWKLDNLSFSESSSVQFQWVPWKPEIVVLGWQKRNLMSSSAVAAHQPCCSMLLAFWDSALLTMVVNSEIIFSNTVFFLAAWINLGIFLRPLSSIRRFHPQNCRSFFCFSHNSV